MNNTKNAALREIFEGSYNILDRHNHRRIGNSVQTMREHTIQNQDSIIDIAIQLPSMIARDIQIRHSEDWWLIFRYKDQFLWSIEVVTQDQWAELEEQNEIFNQEIIAQEQDYLIVYAHALDNPLSGIEQEAFTEISQALNQNIHSIQILHITHISHILGYIVGINTQEMTVDIQQIEVLTGSDAAQALAENDPELCESIKEENEEDICLPPNNIYILIDQESITSTFLADEGIQTQIYIHREDQEEYNMIDIQTFMDDWSDLYLETLFTIKMIDEWLLEIREQHIQQ